MRDLIILGTGVHAQEVVEIVARVNHVDPAWNLLGFLSEDGRQVGQDLNEAPVLGTGADMGKYGAAWFLPLFDWPREASPSREHTATLVDPSSFVSRTASIGTGSIIYPHCYVGLNARLGAGVFALGGCIINHDDVLEDRVVLASAVTLAGNLHVEADCYLGQSCSVRQFVRVGRGSMVGMGAVVVKDVPPNSVMVGNPARRLRDRVPRENDAGGNRV